MEKEIKNLRLGEIFQIKENGPLWVRGSYERSIRKYSIYKYEDICHEIFVKGTKKILI